MSAAPGPAALPAAEVILEGLLDAQREAVTHGTGPLLILAGAGTGKTQVLTRRIAWLIATKRARPEQILALTFTDKAAAEMESRVDQLVPYGFVGATVATFHAFCDRLVREHAVELGLTDPLRVEGQAEILVFLRERLFELGLERYLPLGRPEAHLRALLALFDHARHEDVTPADYERFAESLAASAGDDPARQDRAAAELEKARAYARFEQLLRREGRLDFGSQIRLALELLRTRAHVRREIQDRYRWVLVDEFQDTNHAQFELVRLLAGDRGNLTVVGDDDQSIYRFRGAKVENLLSFMALHPTAREILLVRNFRSGQRILDHAHRLIQANNPARLEHVRHIDKRLVAERIGADGAPFAGTVEAQHHATASDEADRVAAEIAQLLEQGAAARHIAVLARAHTHLDGVALALRARGIRYRRVGQRGLYTRPEVELCLNMLRSLADPDDALALYLALADPLFDADPVDLARLGAQSRRMHRPFLRVALAACDGDGLAPRSREAVRRFAALHAELAALTARRPTSEVLYAFVTGSGLLERLTANDSAESLERVQNLNKLFGIVTRVGPLLRADRVPAFIEHLDLLVQMGDDPTAAEVESDDDAVSLLTAHNAKGLEFDVVFVVQLVEQRFPGYRRPDPMPFPPELRRGDADTEDDHMREERRLFYVAMTRARDRLVLSHASDYGGKRAARVSRFVLEALDLPAPPKAARAASALESMARHAPIADPAAPGVPRVPEGQPLTLSHSQIEDYRECPLRYFYAHVAQVPLAADYRLTYGHALHHAIRIWHQHRMRGLPVHLDDVLTAFDSAWTNEGFLSREHEERMLAAGREALRAFVERDIAERAQPLAIEMEFKFRLGDDVVVGRWDRIDERPEGIVLVDYKSSDVEGPEQAAARVRDSLRDGQLGLYALAYEQTRGVRPARAELHFVGRHLVAGAAVEDEHLARARDRIADAARGIRAGHTTATPDARTCGRCPYQRFCPRSATRGST